MALSDDSADLANRRFAEPADFTGVSVTATLDLSRCSFDAGVILNVRSARNIVVESAIVLGPMVLDVESSVVLTLIDTRFYGEVSISTRGPLTVNMRGATFGAAVTIRASETIGFESMGTRFLGGFTLRTRSAVRVARGARFSGVLDLRYCEFPDRQIFDGAVFDSDCVVDLSDVHCHHDLAL